jgi:Trypsin-co-occurring domain 1
VTILIEVAVGSAGDDILVFEVDRNDMPSGELELAGDESGSIARARKTMIEALDQLRPSLQPVLEMLKTFSPDETTLSFGLKMGGETGIIIAKGTAEVNFSVTMKWNSAS